MATKNPAAALEALAHPATTKVGRFEVREIFLGTLAVLERIGSPLLDRNAQTTLQAWAETLYALTRPSADCLRALDRGREAYSAEALAWADTVSNAEAVALMRAAGEALKRLNAANPAPDDDGDSLENREAPSADPDPTAAGPTDGSSGA